MKILVTGGAGFIGSHVVDALVERRHDVHSIDWEYIPPFANEKAHYHVGDVTVPLSLGTIFRKVEPELTIHLAGLLGTSETWNHIHETVTSNVHGAINVYENCAKIGSAILTVDVGSRWLVPYTITKRTGAEFAFAYGNRFGLPAGALRIFNVYGPRQSTKIIKIIPRFVEAALKDQELVVMGNKEADLVHVTDVAEAFVLAAERMTSVDQVDGILVGSGKPVAVLDVANMIIEIVGKGRIKQVPTRTGEERSDAGYMNDDSAERILGWKPVLDLEDGLRATINWYRNNVFRR